MVTWILLSALLSLILYLIIKKTSLLNYWKDRNIPYEKPLPFIGNLLSVVTLRSAIFNFYNETYFKHPKEKVVGIYEFLSPVLIVKDPEILEKILVKDFQHFTDHVKFAEDGSLFNNVLFQLNGTKWRSVRTKVSPSLSTGKLKLMFNNMIDCTDEMMKTINDNLNKDYEIREVLAMYIINVIANSVFGIELNNKQEKQKFLNCCTSIFHITSLRRFLESALLIVFPKLSAWLGFTFLNDETQNYFNGLIRNTFNQRQLNKDYVREDFVQQMLKLKEMGKIEVQSKDESDDYLGFDNQESAEKNVEMTDDLLVGQAFQFILAGFDPTLVGALCAIYELARHPDIQERARNEVKEVLAKHNGYSFEAIKDMTFVEQCLQESLRLHPIATFLTRICTKDYYLPEVGLHITKGQKLVAPLLAIQRDPKYYPEPDKFKPERFPPNTFRQNFTYLPFGDGPRVCLGMKFGSVMIKLILTKILENYRFTLSPKTKVPFKLNKLSTVVYIPEDKIFVQLHPVNE